MIVEETMSREIRSCHPDADLAAIAVRMWEFDFGCMPVVDEHQELVGILTDRDICMATVTRNLPPRQIHASEVISNQTVRTCRAGDEIEGAMATMARYGVRRLPVLDDAGQVVGVLSIDDIARVAHPMEDDSPSPARFAETVKSICSNRVALR